MLFYCSTCCLSLAFHPQWFPLLQIVQVNSCKFLGVYIDNRLTWKDHINKISKKICKSIGIINRIRYMMLQNVLLNLYLFTFTYLFLSYCNSVFTSNYPSWSKASSVLQWRAIRMIAGRIDSMDTAYCSYKWNAFPLINKYQIMYEHKLLLQIFNNYFRSYADCHSHFTRAQKNCYDASACTNIRLFAIKCSGPTLMANNLVFEGAWPLFLVDVCVCVEFWQAVQKQMMMVVFSMWSTSPKASMSYGLRTC